MRELPTHGDLDNLVELRKSAVFGMHLPPNRRLGAEQSDLQLEDRVLANRRPLSAAQVSLGLEGIGNLLYHRL